MSKKEPHVRVYDELISKNGRINGKHDVADMYEIAENMVKDENHPWWRHVSKELYNEIFNNK